MCLPLFWHAHVANWCKWHISLQRQLGKQHHQKLLGAADPLHPQGRVHPKHLGFGDSLTCESRLQIRAIPRFVTSIGLGDPVDGLYRQGSGYCCATLGV